MFVLTPVQRPQPPFWSRVATFLRKYILAPLPILLVVAAAIVLTALGVKGVKIGGLLGALTGKKPVKAIEKANSIPVGRVRPDGSLIPQGEPDSKGLTQAIVVPIEKPGLFESPNTVRIKPPGEDKPIEVEVPDGVDPKDVQSVVIVAPKVYAVTVKDGSGISAERIEDLLKKYGAR